MLSRCVCLSVCPSQAGTVPKRLNVESRIQRYTIAQGLLFSDAKIGDFRSTSRYISETMQDRDIVTMEHQ